MKSYVIKVGVVVTVVIVLGVVLAPAPAAAPTDVSLLTQACKVRPVGAAYDWAYETVNSRGTVTGVANCGSDGSVQGWDPRPTASGDTVELVVSGQG